MKEINIEKTMPESWRLAPNSTSVSKEAISIASERLTEGLKQDILERRRQQASQSPTGEDTNNFSLLL